MRIQCLQWGRTFSSAERQLLRSYFEPCRYSSMGPHFFKCGKQVGRVSCDCDDFLFNGAALFQVRKALADLEKQTISIQSSMGPHFFKCGKVINNPYNNAAFLLQWGRTFSSAESIDIYTQSVIKWFSSMGPHFFKCGKWY